MKVVDLLIVDAYDEVFAYGRTKAGERLRTNLDELNAIEIGKLKGAVNKEHGSHALWFVAAESDEKIELENLTEGEQTT